jgi:3-oxoacyl-[acyl-carrier protein] reductase
MNALDFEGQHAVITGGAAGIGFAVAKRLIASGASCVTLWDFDETALASATTQLGLHARTVQVDVSAPDFRPFRWAVHLLTRSTAAVRGTACGRSYMMRRTADAGQSVPKLEVP